MKHNNFLFILLLILQAKQINAQITVQTGEIKTTNSISQIKPGALKTYDFSNMKICVERPLQSINLPARDFSLVEAPPRINTDGSISKIAVKRQPLAGETLKMWNPGETIKVFLNTTNGSELLREQVKMFAKEWERVANITFEFVTSKNDAKIKVWFASDKKYWSWIGRDVLSNPFNVYTMNLGFVNSGITPNDVRAIVLHEFGHALGFIHEHQSPSSGIQWDKEKVYAFFAGEPNKWTRADVDLNVFNRFSKTTTNFSSYDPASIMHYEIPPELTLNNIGTTYNTNFSAMDVQYAKMLYPFPVYNSGATGTLRTGDDCDLIDFRVDYNVVPKDKIEFILELGKNSSGRNITWWKQIGIPLKNGTEAYNWVQNHSLIASENRTTFSLQINAADIERNKGISFWKAKFLGAHTLLPYKWQVMEALTGGCRVKLIWKNDSCGQ